MPSLAVVRARVPQDVDLEDRLIYGLTPVRFGYLVIAVLGAMTCSSLGAVPAGVRAGACLALLGAGAALAWGRWSGRPLDRLLLDVAGFAWRHRRPRAGRRAPPARSPVTTPAEPASAPPARGLLGDPLDLTPVARIGRRPPAGVETER
jgi:hypothetical protein